MIDLREYGKDITAVAQAELLKNVKAAVEESGPAHAIEYCNVHATPLSDSISDHFDVKVQRISLKYRNPLNAPQSTEDKILLNHYLESLNEGRAIRDTLFTMGQQDYYYRPILIGMETCLKCHGEPGVDIDSATQSVLYQLYPEDRAYNYRMGEFRGAWKVSFAKREEN